MLLLPHSPHPFVYYLDNHVWCSECTYYSLASPTPSMFSRCSSPHQLKTCPEKTYTMQWTHYVFTYSTPSGHCHFLIPPPPCRFGQLDKLHSQPLLCYGLSDSSSVDDLAGQLFTLTFTDNGMNTMDNINKLWNSWIDFWANGSSQSIVFSPPAPIPVAEVAASLSHLHRLYIPHLQSFSLDMISINTHLPDICHLGTPLNVHPALTVSSAWLSKPNNYHSTRALQLLSNIEVGIQKYSHLLLTTIRRGSYDTIKHELVILQYATLGIRWKTNEVMSCKAEIWKALDELKKQLKLLQDSTEMRGPAEFNSGK